MFEGSFCAVVTPFKSGKFDEDAFRGLVDRLIRGGTAGIVPCGTTGEAPALEPEEAARVVRAAVEEARGRAVVVAGIGTNATAKTVHQAEAIGRLGPDAFLVTVPYYNKPTQEGLYLHFREVARAAGRPVMVYNIPGRTGVNMTPATLARLAKDCPEVRALKDAAGSLDQTSETVARLPASFSVLSGDDSLTLPMMSVGAKGVVSVLANVLPKETARLCALAKKGDLTAAGAVHRKVLPLIKALFVETNPIPVKTALAMLGLCGPEFRLPMCAPSAATKALLKAELKRAGARR